MSQKQYKNDDCFYRRGSVIANFTIQYQTMNSIQFVKLQDSFQSNGGLSTMPAVVLNVSSTKGKPTDLSKVLYLPNIDESKSLKIVKNYDDFIALLASFLPSPFPPFLPLPLPFPPPFPPSTHPSIHPSLIHSLRNSSF